MKHLDDDDWERLVKDTEKNKKISEAYKELSEAPYFYKKYKNYENKSNPETLIRYKGKLNLTSFGRGVENSQVKSFREDYNNAVSKGDYVRATYARKQEMLERIADLKYNYIYHHSEMPYSLREEKLNKLNALEKRISSRNSNLNSTIKENMLKTLKKR